MRDIGHILHFRTDISPFLIHLTRPNGTDDAAAVLQKILSEKQLRPGPTLVSTARYGGITTGMSAMQLSQFFAAVCFTETPLNEVHSLLDIQYRQVDLAQFGLVFIKQRLQERGVAPVVYINNEQGDQDLVMRALFSISQSDIAAAQLLLPLISVFGKKIRPPGVQEHLEGTLDWRWEREWRYPYVRGPLMFDSADVFMGLCAHDRIPEYESLLHPVEFIDPTRNMKWYASKLIKARQRLDLKYSVV